MIRVVKCSKYNCPNPATWKTGTWWLCDEHARQMLTGKEYDEGRGNLGWGTTYKSGLCKAEDYWIGQIPLDMTVEVEDNVAADHDEELNSFANREMVGAEDASILEWGGHGDIGNK